MYDGSIFSTFYQHFFFLLLLMDVLVVNRYPNWITTLYHYGLGLAFHVGYLYFEHYNHRFVGSVYAFFEKKLLVLSTIFRCWLLFFLCSGYYLPFRNCLEIFFLVLQVASLQSMITFHSYMQKNILFSSTIYQNIVSPKHAINKSVKNQLSLNLFIGILLFRTDSYHASQKTIALQYIFILFFFFLYGENDIFVYVPVFICRCVCLCLCTHVEAIGQM